MNGVQINLSALARAGRMLFVLLVALLLLGGLGLFHTGAEKESILQGVGLDRQVREADGIALMIAGSFIVMVAALAAIAFSINRIARRQRDFEAAIANREPEGR